MRRPDKTETIQWQGFDVTVETWIGPTDSQWDGDFPLEEGAEGYDMTVAVVLDVADQRFRADDSLGSIWIVPDREGYRYLDETEEELRKNALAALDEEIRAIAGGRDVRAAQKRCELTQQLVREFQQDAFRRERDAVLAELGAKEGGAS